MTLHDLFLLHWDSSLDHQTIPPNIGPYAVYTKDDGKLFFYIKKLSLTNPI